MMTEDEPLVPDQVIPRGHHYVWRSKRYGMMVESTNGTAVERSPNDVVDVEWDAHDSRLATPLATLGGDEPQMRYVDVPPARAEMLALADAPDAVWTWLVNPGTPVYWRTGPKLTDELIFGGLVVESTDIPIGVVRAEVLTPDEADARRDAWFNQS